MRRTAPSVRLLTGRPRGEVGDRARLSEGDSTTATVRTSLANTMPSAQSQTHEATGRDAVHMKGPGQARPQGQTQRVVTRDGGWRLMGTLPPSGRDGGGGCTV